MNAELKAKWIAALRSGEYIQGRSYLKSHSREGETKHCCLGVLAEICGYESSVRKVSGVNLSHSVFDFGSSGLEEGNLPTLVANYLGIPDQDVLTVMNDGSVVNFVFVQKSFSEIADWIDENL